jgi:Mn2+/Fe2+ NRAMP family transporter
MATTSTQSPSARPWYQRLGPGLITACVVIGPGSILTSSNVGVRNGYGLSWVVVVAVIFMLAFMSMGARLGVSSEKSTGTLLAERVGRWFAVLIGVCVFFISSAFQFGNNLGVHFALKTYADFPYWIVLFNALAIGFLLFSKHLYQALEKLMMIFVAIMLVAFAINLIVAGPRFGEWFAGFVPGGVKVNLTVLGLVGTTFVTSAALYQSYLVRQKGWSQNELRDGMIDVRVGAGIMAVITLMLMATPATVFHQDFKIESVVENPGDSLEAKGTLIIDDADPEEFDRVKKRAEQEINWETNSPRWTKIYSQIEYEALPDKQKTKPREFQGLPEVGKSLEPLFGAVGPMLFFLGVFSAAYSSFLVNSMIGGFILADGLGLGNTPEDRWPRIFTIIVLLTGMGVGLYCILVLHEKSPVELIVAAQAVTVVASPLVAGSLLWLTSKRDVMGDNVNGPLLTVFGVVGFILLLAMSANTLMNVLGKLGWITPQG